MDMGVSGMLLVTSLSLTVVILSLCLSSRLVETNMFNIRHLPDTNQ